MSDAPSAEPFVLKSAFARWLGPLLDGLRELGGEAKPPVVVETIARNENVSAELLAERLNSGQPRFNNQVSWARFYLTKAGLTAPTDTKTNLWRLTDAGREARLDLAQSQALVDEVWARLRDDKLDAESAAPPQDDLQVSPGSDVCWFVGASYGRQVDQTERFYAEGVWEIDSPSERDQEQVRSMRPGDRIAIKSTYVRKHGLPFDARGVTHSVMAIKATGVVTANPGDGQRIEVDWTPLPRPREWFFYTYQPTIWRVRPDKPERAALIRFAFEGELQDFEFWARAWHEQGTAEASEAAMPADSGFVTDDAATDAEPPPPYTLADISSDGCFLLEARLASMLELLQRKKNIVLQGPPGTGKTWLARRLAYALVGARDPARVTAVQFQPSYAYEDFVLGYRPSSDGRLQLVEGLFLRLIAQARRTQEPVVLVIEEINRGDPAQVFGELLTLLEAGQRGGEGLRLAYAAAGDAPVSVPDNLYVIGTMNLADRSLALVDLALRRRFGFVDLQPELGERWRAALLALGATLGLLAEVATRMGELNTAIAAARGLGEQFRVGHSYVTPLATPGGDAEAWSGWWRSVVRDELGPLLAEYWHEEPETARQHADQLIAGL